MTVFVLVLATLSSCNKDKTNSPVVGHWGCEMYVSNRPLDTVPYEKIDTLYYEVGDGLGIEVFFGNDGSGKLYLNESPALIKKFNCSYSYDEDLNQVVVEAPGLLYAIYHTILALNENRAVFDVEELTSSTMVASWTNSVSEDVPFFERFYLRKID